MKSRRFAKANRGKLKRPGEMNKLESEYAAHLESLKTAGEILDFGYESLKLRLANKTFYTPDFIILTTDCGIELHEVKAFWRSKNAPHVEPTSSVKIKVAAESHPFKFVMVWNVKGLGWQRQEY